MSRQDHLQKVKNGVKNANDFDITVLIKGDFLVRERLTESWKELRGLKQDLIIDENFEDSISVYQAEILGIISKD